MQIVASRILNLYRMKKLVLIIAAVFFGTAMTKAATIEDKVATVNYRYGNSFIFVENGVTFSVYPDGEFDFYIDNRVNVGVGARVGNVGITFNSGYNYNPFVQYDDYGAVIQVENIPIYYDYYGRVSQIGGVDVWYRNGRVRRLGGLNVFYNGGVFSHYTGFINIYNRGYVYRPFHRWFARPAVGFCNVWTSPYRRWYNPVRYTWYRPYRNNYRRAYAQIGREHRYNRTRRSKVYRNDNRVAVRENRGRRNADFSRRNDGIAQRRSSTRRNNDSELRRNSGRSVATRGKDVRRSSDAAVQRRTGTRSNAESSRRNGNREISYSDRSLRLKESRGSNSGVRSNKGNSVSKRTVSRTPRSTSVTQRKVTQTPRKRTVERTTTTYRKPSNRSVASSRSSSKRTKSVSRASTPQRRTVSRSASTNRSSSGTSRTSRSSRRQ